MLRTLSIILIVFSVSFQFGCSWFSASQNSNSGAQQNSAANAQEIADANVALAEGSRLFDNGETEKAIELLNRAVELNPDLAEAYFKLGVAYALIEARDASIVESQVEQTPLPGETRPKAKKTNSEKAFEKAVQAYKKHVESNPNDDIAFFNMGRAYNKLNEDEDAARALRQAVKLKPDDTEYQTELGAILIKLAQYHEAIAPLRKAIDLDPENSRAIDLLEDAEAGRKRVDYTSVKTQTNSNSNANTNSNTQTPEANASTKPKPPETKETKETKTAPSANKPK